MKNYLRLGLCLAILVLLGAGSASAAWNWSGNSAPADALNVNSVFADPGAYEGEIKVHGVVADVTTEAATFLLIDFREYRSCGQLNCASKFVKVHYGGGELPSLKNEVVVTGEMIPEGQGYLLQAKTIQVLKP